MVASMALSPARRGRTRHPLPARDAPAAAGLVRLVVRQFVSPQRPGREDKKRDAGDERDGVLAVGELAADEASETNRDQVNDGGRHCDAEEHVSDRVPGGECNWSKVSSATRVACRTGPRWVSVSIRLLDYSLSE
jgi:hypothetical protein